MMDNGDWGQSDNETLRRDIRDLLEHVEAILTYREGGEMYTKALGNIADIDHKYRGLDK